MNEKLSNAAALSDTREQMMQKFKPVIKSLPRLAIATTAAMPDCMARIALPLAEFIVEVD